MARFSSLLLLLAALPTLGIGQGSPNTDTRPDAATLLQQVNKKYADAKYYHIEVIEEDDIKGDLSRTWDKSLLTAIMAPDNRYRFEAHSQFGMSLKVSDGKTETNYNADSHEYTQAELTGPGPLKPKSPIYRMTADLAKTTGLVASLSNIGDSLFSPAYLPDEDLSIDGKLIPCYVIRGKHKYRGGSTDVVGETTLWIDRGTLLIRKQSFQQKGPILIGSLQEFIDNQTSIYPVTDLGISSMPDSLFSFKPEAGTQLVKQFSDPFHPKDTLAGNLAPPLTFRDASGKLVSLQGFRGKAVLLDFWATWCAPCVAALKPLKKLQEEAQPKGLVVLSIDEDDEPGSGDKLFAKQGFTWPNFLDADGEIWRSFHGTSGVPFYVLIDAGGRITFSKSGAQDTDLRAAIAKLGIELPASQPVSERKPAQ